MQPAQQCLPTMDNHGVTWQLLQAHPASSKVDRVEACHDTVLPRRNMVNMA